MGSYTLILGTGKNKRQWRLSADEFERFEMEYEENELVDMSDWKSTRKLVETAPPPRIKVI